MSLKNLTICGKDMTAKGEAEAIEQVEKQYMDDKVLVVFLPECHESLAGIIAGDSGNISTSRPLC